MVGRRVAWRSHQTFHEAKRWTSAHAPHATQHHFAVIRDPVERVPSEYDHLSRGWCCPYFFEGGEIAKFMFGGKLRAKYAHDKFLWYLRHPDCPANNRQSWTLADFGGSMAEGFAVPSSFVLFWRPWYGYAANYTLRMNNDDRMLALGIQFVDTAVAALVNEELCFGSALLLYRFEGTRNFVTKACDRGGGCCQPNVQGFKLRVLELLEIDCTIRTQSRKANSAGNSRSSKFSDEIRMRNRLDDLLYRYTLSRYHAQVSEMRTEVCTAEARQLSPALPRFQLEVVLPQACTFSAAAASTVLAVRDAGVTFADMKTGIWHHSKACPDIRFQFLDTQHQHDAMHGDVCREARSGGSKWNCPVGCTPPTNPARPPYCLMAQHSKAACRVKVAVSCAHGKGCTLLNETNALV
jgi:hypothetical protein